MEIKIKTNIGGKYLYLFQWAGLIFAQLLALVCYYYWVEGTLSLKARLAAVGVQLFCLFLGYILFTRFRTFTISEDGIKMTDGSYTPKEVTIAMYEVKSVKAHGTQYFNFSILKVLTTKKSFLFILFNPESTYENTIPLTPELEAMKMRPLALLVENAFTYFKKVSN